MSPSLLNLEQIKITFADNLKQIFYSGEGSLTESFDYFGGEEIVGDSGSPCADRWCTNTCSYEG